MSTYDQIENLGTVCLIFGIVVAGFGVVGIFTFDAPHDVSAEASKMADMSDSELQRYLIDWNVEDGNDDEREYTAQEVVNEMEDQNQSSFIFNLISELLLVVAGLLGAYYGHKRGDLE
ncbi:hypothetical protein [Haloarcula sp. CGMCC 1.6347]|uniref:hypothetical protein n=1 Tax=Haloarcula sp. CGMCC 1.6347 TaxID=3111455 RepID=UPI00300E8BEF